MSPGEGERRAAEEKGHVAAQLRGKLEQPWVGYLLGISALWMVFGNLILAPRGPSGNLAINLLSSLGPVLLLAALAKLGASLWAERRSARR